MKLKLFHDSENDIIIHRPGQVISTHRWLFMVASTLENTSIG